LTYPGNNAEVTCRQVSVFQATSNFRSDDVIVTLKHAFDEVSAATVVCGTALELSWCDAGHDRI